MRSNRLAYTALIATAAGLAAMSGCSGNSTGKPVVGAITFTNSSGAPATAIKQLSTGESTYLSVNVTNDSQQLGTDWSSYCGSAPPPGTPIPPGQLQDNTCGSFVPSHTTSGPIPNYVTSGSGYVTQYTAPTAVPKSGTVTLYATSTTDRSEASLVTLTITGQAVSIQLAPAPPATIDVSASVQIKAVVNNDPANAGVTWTATCAPSTDCGTFNPTTTTSGVATTFTAPAMQPSNAGNLLQIIATSVTDPTKTAVATVSITVPPSSMATAADSN